MGILFTDQSKTCPRHILLADDDEEDIEIFREALKEISPEVDVVTTGDGTGAIKILSFFTPDIIFLDINMPVMNGVDCLAQIRSLPHLREVPVIMYSTAATEPSLQDAFRLGASRYIKKPGSFSAIKASLEKVFSSTPEELLRSQYPGSFYLASEG